METSVFGAEFVAMKHGIETLRGLRYKLRMMGVPISGPSYVYCDNKSVVMNGSTPHSTLKKKSNELCFHAVREAVAMNEVADVATKILPTGIKKDYLIGKLLYHVVEGSGKSD